MLYVDGPNTDKVLCFLGGSSSPVSSLAATFSVAVQDLLFDCITGIITDESSSSFSSVSVKYKQQLVFEKQHSTWIPSHTPSHNNILIYMIKVWIHKMILQWFAHNSLSWLAVWKSTHLRGTYFAGSYIYPIFNIGLNTMDTMKIPLCSCHSSHKAEKKIPKHFWSNANSPWLKLCIFTQVPKHSLKCSRSTCGSKWQMTADHKWALHAWVSLKHVFKFKFFKHKH